MSTDSVHAVKLPWHALRSRIASILVNLCVSTACAPKRLSGVRCSRNVTSRRRVMLSVAPEPWCTQSMRNSRAGRKVFSSFAVAFSDRRGVSLACRCHTVAPRPQLLGDRNRGQEVVRTTLVCTLQARSYVAQALTRWVRKRGAHVAHCVLSGNNGVDTDWRARTYRSRLHLTSPVSETASSLLG